MARVIACDKCGAVISSRYKRCPECNAPLKKPGGFLRFVLLIVVLLIVFNRMGGDGTNGFVDRVMDLTQTNEEHVRSVKYGSPAAYPNITYAAAFDSFFGSPTWKYFEGSHEGSDEIYDVVEFTGTCRYKDSDVKARLQFTLNDDGETFQATYLSFNDVPQTNVLMLALIEKAFTEYQNKNDW